MPNDDIAIKVHRVTKDFHLPNEKASSLKTSLVHFVTRDKGYEIQHALRGVSFEIKKGEFFGIVGRNGSGKSTLLKILSGIYQPTTGSVSHSGKLIPFIELGVGFNPELTGRENVYMNGALLGFSVKQVDAMYQEIVKFAELENFMDQKLKNYSSGMQVRLAFSVAIKAEGDILVLDEVLAVGDEAFQRKCNDYFFKAKREGKTVVLVTHSMESVRQFCDRAVLIDEGTIQCEGNADKVASAYSRMFLMEYAEEIAKKDEKHKEVAQLSDVTVKNVEVLQGNKPTKVVNFHENFSINFMFNATQSYDNLRFAVHLIDQAGRINLELSTRLIGGYKLKKGDNSIRFEVDNIYTEGDYYLNFAIKNLDTNNLLIKEQEISKFSILGLDTSIYDKNSLTHPKVKVWVDEIQKET